MVERNEKAALTGDAPNSPVQSATTPPSTDRDDSEGSHLEKSDQSTKEEEDQYPHGLKLFSLVGATIVSVFLIALDQVSIIPSPSWRCEVFI